MLEAGQTFARYVIEAPIGEGGMGEVYRAFDEKLRRKVALKVLHPDLAVPDAAARLVREARAAAAFAHPNTIAIYDLGEIDGNVFLVMELISGASLRAYVGDPSVPVATKLRWLVDIARGLGAAHKAGLVHRDVKPTNVMVSDDGVVKVLDFGLAKPLEASSFHTDVGLVVGTPRYMAPELFTGMRADARTDQYAFGVTAYELLSGVHPGGPTGPVPAALDALVPELRPAVARIVARTLARDPGERFATMNEVASAIEEELLTTRASEVREASPSTRREGVVRPGDAALALAPTELPPSLDVSARALALRSASAVAAKTSVAPLASVASAPTSRRGRGVALIAVLVLGGAYGATRLLGWDAASFLGAADAAPASSSAGDGATALSDALDAGQDAQAALLGGGDGATLLSDALDAAADSALADALADADTLADADASPTSGSRPLQLDDFQDPWAKPAPPPPAPPSPVSPRR